jgi:hypothetical protein
MTSAVALVAQAAATWYLTGLIWVVQVVHYPLFSMADRATFPAFAAAHGRLISLVVGPAMLVEALLATWLVVDRPAELPVWWVWAGLGLVAVIWASTAVLQVPMHARLSGGFDAQAHAWLVSSNWIRTAAWTLRALLCAAMLIRVAARHPAG